jgi:hypothetical protein
MDLPVESDRFEAEDEELQAGLRTDEPARPLLERLMWAGALVTAGVLLNALVPDPATLPPRGQLRAVSVSAFAGATAPTAPMPAQGEAAVLGRPTTVGTSGRSDGFAYDRCVVSLSLGAVQGTCLREGGEVPGTLPGNQAVQVWLHRDAKGWKIERVASGS